MRILFLNSEYPPVGAGAGNASANLARLLVQMGDEVVVITSAFGRLPKSEIIDGVRILRGPARRRRADRSAVLEQTMFIAGAAYRSLLLMREFRPGVVLAFFGLPSGAVAWLLKVTFGIPYVVSLRGGDVPGFRPYDFWLYHKVAAGLLRVIWHRAEAVVANSAGLCDLARAFDATIDISVVANGVDLKRFPTTDRNWSSPRILSVGRIVHQKGLDLAVTALAGLKDLDWEWSVAGDGPELPKLQSMIRKRGLDGRVHFLGWKETQELEHEYAKANLFLFPSRDEGMPNAVLEAMASGLPVIATRIAGNEELVLDGETGTLVPIENAEALGDALRRLLADGKERQRLGRAGRERVKQDYAWQRAANLYQSILEKATSH
jgi:glycosyltransferase involved in cell wall biosynthesis